MFLIMWSMYESTPVKAVHYLFLISVILLFIRRIAWKIYYSPLNCIKSWVYPEHVFHSLAYMQWLLKFFFKNGFKIFIACFKFTGWCGLFLYKLIFWHHALLLDHRGPQTGGLYVCGRNLTSFKKLIFDFELCFLIYFSCMAKECIVCFVNYLFKCRNS